MKALVAVLVFGFSATAMARADLVAQEDIALAANAKTVALSKKVSCKLEVTPAKYDRIIKKDTEFSFKDYVWTTTPRGLSRAELNTTISDILIANGVPAERASAFISSTASKSSEEMLEELTQTFGARLNLDYPTSKVTMVSGSTGSESLLLCDGIAAKSARELTDLLLEDGLLKPSNEF